MMTIVMLNVLFAIVGLLIAVGIPVAGLFWQARETAPVDRPATGGVARTQSVAPGVSRSAHQTRWQT